MATVPRVRVTGTTVKKNCMCRLFTGRNHNHAHTHYTRPRMDGQAELAWVSWLNIKWAYPRTASHLCSNLARRMPIECTMMRLRLRVGQTILYSLH